MNKVGDYVERTWQEEAEADLIKQKAIAEAELEIFSKHGGVLTIRE